MVELSKQEMLNVSGGANWFSASFLNALSRAVTTLMDLGKSLGTSIRRTINGTVCPV